MFDRRLVKCFDWGLLGLTLMLGGVGIMTLFSAVTAGAGAHPGGLYMRQLMWYGVGFIIMIISFLFNYKLLERWAYAIYGGCIAILAGVLLFGKYAGGAKRWIALGPVSIQPSEMVKIAVIIMLAGYYYKHADTRGFSFRGLIFPFFIVVIPFLLIVKQPDLGTALLVALIAGSMTMFVKVERRTFLAILSTCIVTGPSIWFLLKDYQKKRILTFLDPERDPLGAGYHIIQSKIAIGSGMLTGKGYLKGTQNSLSFLPEQHTDFIFSVLSEEWGFLGSMSVLLLFLLIIVRGLNVAYECREPFGAILAVGLTAVIFWQVTINIGMVMGLMPVVGVPLPLVSYGGSSMITVMTCIGLLMNISMRRFVRD
ncbi:MAG: rod shape-determining protein RodA [Desulfobacterales bacterium]|nr:rod shape-determining protein RodA [Desulfobacterales bacterium]